MMILTPTGQLKKQVTDLDDLRWLEADCIQNCCPERTMAEIETDSQGFAGDIEVGFGLLNDEG
jgi:hypothetical protein